jgi:chromosome segregation and condensation protein ScpB
MDKDEKDPRQEELREAYAKWLNVTRQELSEALRKSLRNAEDTKELREAYAKWRKVTRQELGKALHKAYEHVEDTDELVEAYLRRCSATVALSSTFFDGLEERW